MANTTSTVAIWPGSVGSVWGYRKELASAEPRYRLLIIPSLLGGVTGALLLEVTPAAGFERAVPFLILFATVLLMVQETVQRFFKTAEPGTRKSAAWLTGAMLFQFGVGVYGGYFGGGIGILMLAALGILGMTDIHEMNSLKAVLGGAVNGIAALYFVWKGMVDWPYVVVMGIGALAGGYGGADVAHRIGRKAVRRTVIAIGWCMAIWLFYRSR